MSSIPMNDSYASAEYDYLVASALHLYAGVTSLNDLRELFHHWSLPEDKAVELKVRRKRLRESAIVISTLTDWEKIKSTDTTDVLARESIQNMPEVMTEYFVALNSYFELHAPGFAPYIQPLTKISASETGIQWELKHSLISRILEDIPTISKGYDLGIDQQYAIFHLVTSKVKTLPDYYSNLLLCLKQPQDHQSKSHANGSEIFEAPELSLRQVLYALMAMLYMWPQVDVVTQDSAQESESILKLANSLTEIIQSQHHELIKQYEMMAKMPSQPTKGSGGRPEGSYDKTKLEIHWLLCEADRRSKEKFGNRENLIHEYGTQFDFNDQSFNSINKWFRKNEHNLHESDFELLSEKYPQSKYRVYKLLVARDELISQRSSGKGT